jgi:hypothetical protein
MFGALTLFQSERRAAMTEKAHRFTKSAIDELNHNSGARPVPRRDFALLMVGLAALLVLLYALIVLSNLSSG